MGQRPPYLGWFPPWPRLRPEHVDVLVLLSSVPLSAGRLPAQMHTTSVTVLRYLTSPHADLWTYCHQPVMSCEQNNICPYYCLCKCSLLLLCCVLHDVRHEMREIKRKKAKNIQKSILNLLIMSTSALNANSAQNPPPPMTRASYWDFMARWRRVNLVTVPNAAAFLVRLIHIFAGVPNKSWPFVSGRKENTAQHQLWRSFCPFYWSF